MKVLKKRAKVMVITCAKSLKLIKNLAQRNYENLILTDCIQTVDSHEDIDILVLDLNLCHKEGHHFISNMKKRNSEILVYASADKLKLIKKVAVFDFR